MLFHPVNPEDTVCIAVIQYEDTKYELGFCIDCIASVTDE
jgi:hypothetical protein